jgi:hypothetical protein
MSTVTSPIDAEPVGPQGPGLTSRSAPPAVNGLLPDCLFTRRRLRRSLREGSQRGRHDGRFPR